MTSCGRLCRSWRAKIGDLPWVEDGIDRGEFNAVRGLILLVDTGHTARVLEEPWVVEGRNYPALESLRFLAANDPETLDKIMSHPTISDGVTDQEAKILATLHRVDPDLLGKLLDPEQVTLEERTITLPLAGETELTIIRTRPGVDRTMGSPGAFRTQHRGVHGTPLPTTPGDLFVRGGPRSRAEL